MDNTELQTAFKLLYKELKHYARNNPEGNIPHVEDYAEHIDRIVSIVKRDF